MVRHSFSKPLRLKLVSQCVAVVGLICGLALSLRLDDARAVASTVYADSASGNDSTGDGTSSSPYRTFHKAYTAAVAGDTIRLTGTFTWTDANETGDVAGTGYTLAKNLTIQGDSRASTIIQADSTRGAANRMVFFVAANTTVTIRDMTIRYGRVTSTGQGGGITLAGAYCGNYPCPSITATATLERVDIEQNDAPSSPNVMRRAGGIYMQEASTLTLIDSSVSSNTCTCYLYSAGGIAGGEQSQKLTISGSTIANNSATSTSGATYPFDYSSVGSAIALQRFGQFVMTNSTVFGNTTNHYGALVLYYQTRPTITNSTIAGNSASLGAGGILWKTIWSGDYLKLHMKNVLLADNAGVSGAPDDFYSATDSYSTTHIVSVNSIVEASTNKDFSGSGNITGQQASLGLSGTLGLNGSSRGTLTLALSASSVAIDAGSATAHGTAGYTVTPPTSDQRAAPRVGTLDIGSFEYGSASPTTSTTSTSTTSTTTTSTTTTSTTTTSTTSTSTTSTTISSSSTSTIASSSTLAQSGTTTSSSQVVTTTGPPATSLAAVISPTTLAGNSEVSVEPTAGMTASPASAGTSTTFVQALVSSTSTVPRLDSASVRGDTEPSESAQVAETTTTLTSRVRNSEVAPEAPAVTIGQASAFVNGKPVSLSISRANNTLTISGAGLTMTLAAVLDDGAVVPLDPDGNIRLEQTRLLQMSALGVGLSSEAEVWIYSDPVKIGSVKPDAEGKVSARLKVPDEVPGGDHRFVVKARSQTGDETTMAVGIGVGAAPEGVSIGWIISIPLAMAVAAALIIPARRRRRSAATI